MSAWIGVIQLELVYHLKRLTVNVHVHTTTGPGAAALSHLREVKRRDKRMAHMRIRKKSPGN